MKRVELSETEIRWIINSLQRDIRQTSEAIDEYKQAPDVSEAIVNLLQLDADNKGNILGKLVNKLG
jgi:hypothetical protein